MITEVTYSAFSSHVSLQAKLHLLTLQPHLLLARCSLHPQRRHHLNGRPAYKLVVSLLLLSW